MQIRVFIYVYIPPGAAARPQGGAAPPAAPAPRPAAQAAPPAVALPEQNQPVAGTAPQPEPESILVDGMLMESTLLCICTCIIVALGESVLCLMQMKVTQSLCCS